MTTTDGIEAVFLETHNWGKSAKFFQALGFQLEFATDQEPGIQIMLKVADPDTLELDPVVEVVTPFEDTHYGTREMTVRDPDGRVWSLQGAGSPPSTAGES